MDIVCLGDISINTLHKGDDDDDDDDDDDNNNNKKINYVNTHSNTTMYFFTLLATSFGHYGHHQAYKGKGKVIP